MKINPIPAHNAVNSYKDKKVDTSRQSGFAMGSDTVEFSDGAQSFASVIKQVRTEMDVRTPGDNKRFADIAKQVKEGTYSVSGAKVAEKILGGMIDEKV